MVSKYFRRASLSLVDRPDCFRLVKILPGAKNDRLRCSLSVHEISSCIGTYITGSYVWGSKCNPREILVDDEPVQIRQSLWTFLRHLRAPDVIVTVWLDALCIKQDDTSEKTQQIRLMPKIFQGGGESISWLGEADAVIHRAFDIVEQQARRRFQLSPDEWSCVMNLLNHDYFKRRWIVQEVVLPQIVTLQCGDRRLPLTTLESFLAYISCWQSERLHAQVHQSMVRRLCRDHSTRHLHGGGFHLSDLLLRYQDTVCKKPCDKVNAFLGMITDGHLLYCEDDSQALYKIAMASSRRRDLDLIAYGLFMQQELGLAVCTSSPQVSTTPNRDRYACKTFVEVK